jgi:hypothetical protein
MRKWVFVGLAAVGGLGLIATVVLVSGVLRSGSATECSKLARPQNGSPLMSSTMTTPVGAQAAAGFPVLLPHVQAARPANLTHTWVDDRHRRVALVFAGGKVTIVLARANYSDARTDFRRFIAQNHAAAIIGQVHEQPALVISPRTDGCGSNPAWVEFDHRGLDISIYSTNYGTQALLSVADSLVALSAPGVVTGIAAPCAGPPPAAMDPVTVFAVRDGRTVARQVTQYKGRHDRYRFVLAPGRYQISAPRSADKSPQSVLVRSGQTSTVSFPNTCY